MKKIEIDCRTCENCTGNSCKPYGADADQAVKACAENFFRSYKEKIIPPSDKKNI